MDDDERPSRDTAAARPIPSPGASIAGGRVANGETAARSPPAAGEAPPSARSSSRPSPARSSKVDHFPSKLSKKQKKALKDAHRPLDSWERYRALTDVLDEAIDLVDLADHKARFALVIMAALNVVLFFVAVRTDLVEAISRRSSGPSWASTS